MERAKISGKGGRSQTGGRYDNADGSGKNARKGRPQPWWGGGTEGPGARGAAGAKDLREAGEVKTGRGDRGTAVRTRVEEAHAEGGGCCSDLWA